MNTKLSKKLRKIAYAMVMSAEKADPKTEIKKVSYTRNRAGTVTVAPNTWKGAYKALKKNIRNQGPDSFGTRVNKSAGAL